MDARTISTAQMLMAKGKSKTLKETDLYGPIRDYLQAQGYEVRGEVEGWVIAARKGDDLFIVEL